VHTIRFYSLAQKADVEYADETQALQDDVGSATPRNKSYAPDSMYSCSDIALLSTG
jgi:hypothetical protein